MDTVLLIVAMIGAVVIVDLLFSFIKKPRKLYIIHLSFEAEDETHTSYAFIEILTVETKSKAKFKARVNDYIQWYEDALIAKYKEGYTRKSIALESIVPMN